jgi:glutamine synthetase
VLQADKTVCGWFDPAFIETFVGVKQAELARVAELNADETCALYRTLY